MVWIKGLGLTVFAAAPYVLPSSGLGQPLPFDATGDMRTDLLGFSTDSNSAPVLWNNVWEESENTAVFNVCVLSSHWPSPRI